MPVGHSHHAEREQHRGRGEQHHDLEPRGKGIAATARPFDDLERDVREFPRHGVTISAFAASRHIEASYRRRSGIAARPSARPHLMEGEAG